MTLWAKIDVNFPSDPRIIAAGVSAELLYIRAVLHARCALSNGYVDSRVLNVIGHGLRRPVTQHAKRLVDVGLWELAPGGWQIPERVWRKWNPTSDEVKAKREKEAARKAEWRASRNVPAGQPADSENVPTGRKNVSHDVTEPEPETESSTYIPLRVVTGAVDNSRGARILEALVTLERSQANGGVRNPAAWTKTVRTRIETEHGARITELVTRYPSAPDSVIVAAVLGDTHSLRYYQENP